MLIEDAYRSSGYRSHHDPDYEAWMETVKQQLPRAQVMTLSDVPAIPFSHPRRASWWDEMKGLSLADVDELRRTSQQGL